MNALEVKEYLLQHEDKIIGLLEEIGLNDVHKNGKEIRSARRDGGNPTAIRIKLNEYLTYNNYNENKKGDIYKLIGDTLGWDNFPKSFNYICSYLNIDGTYEKIEREDIFGGFFSQFSKKTNDELKCDITTYPIETLGYYELCGNELFQRDGIDLSTQNKYNIGYDWVTHRLIIPEFSFEGELAGVTGRYNGTDWEKQGESKYYPIIEFPKSQVLFGYSQNYDELTESTIWLIESQKGVMRMDSLGKKNFLALGGKSLSPIQIKYIQNLNPKNIIVALDEGVDESIFIELCNLLKPQSSFFTYKVGYIYDKNNEYLKKGSKDSPADLSIEELKKLSKKVRWI